MSKRQKSGINVEYLETRENIFYLEFEKLMFENDLNHDIDREEILYFCVDDMITCDMIVRKDMYFNRRGR